MKIRNRSSTPSKLQIINNEMPLVDAGSYHNLQNKINHESIGVQIAREV